jgi:hypothetical protein
VIKSLLIEVQLFQNLENKQSYTELHKHKHTIKLSHTQEIPLSIQELMEIGIIPVLKQSVSDYHIMLTGLIWLF